MEALVGIKCRSGKPPLLLCSSWYQVDLLVDGLGGFPVYGFADSWVGRLVDLQV